MPVYLELFSNPHSSLDSFSDASLSDAGLRTMQNSFNKTDGGPSTMNAYLRKAEFGIGVMDYVSGRPLREFQDLAQEVYKTRRLKDGVLSVDPYLYERGRQFAAITWPLKDGVSHDRKTINWIMSMVKPKFGTVKYEVQAVFAKICEDGSITL